MENNINASTKDHILDVAKANKHYTNQEIGDIVGVSEATVRRVFKKYSDPRIHRIEYDLQIQLDTPIRVPLETGIMVTADWHIPLYSKKWINNMLDTAHKNHIKRLAIAGDFFNFDSLSSYDPKQVTAGLQLELSEGKSIAMLLDQVFDEIIFTFGNHDQRFAAKLGHTIGFIDSMKAVLPTKNFRFSSLDHFWIDDPQAEFPWYVCHPKAYNSIPLSGGLKLSDKYNASIITAHSHHLAMGYAKDGVRKLVESGGLFNRDVTAYLQRTTSFPQWTNGFVYITEDGTANVIGEGMHGRI